MALRRASFFAFSAAFACSAPFFGCHAGGGTSPSDAFPAAGAGGTGGAPIATAGAGGTSIAGAGGANVAGSGGGIQIGTGGMTSMPMGTTVVYAHTNTTLYSIDPTSASLTPTTLGDFDCIGGGSGNDGSMTDIAVSKDGALWGVSQHFLYALTPMSGATVACGTPIALPTTQKSVFFGLTFAPVGILDPVKEVLVAGDTSGALWAIDDAGNVTQHGTFGTVPKNDGRGHNYDKSNVGNPWELSGDIVFLANAGSPIGFATVRDCQDTTCDTADTLIEINVDAIADEGTQQVTKSVRGQIVKAQDCTTGKDTDYGSLYGIAAFNDKVFGFSHSGAIVTINNDDGSACLVTSFMNAWSGAGVTTVAPIIAPPDVE